MHPGCSSCYEGSRLIIGIFCDDSSVICDLYYGSDGDGSYWRFFRHVYFWEGRGPVGSRHVRTAAAMFSCVHPVRVNRGIGRQFFEECAGVGVGFQF